MSQFEETKTASAEVEQKPQTAALLQPGKSNRANIGSWPGKGYTWNAGSGEWNWTAGGEEPHPDMKWSQKDGWHWPEGTTPKEWPFPVSGHTTSTDAETAAMEAVARDKDPKWTANTPAPQPPLVSGGHMTLEGKARNLYISASDPKVHMSWEELSIGQKQPWLVEAQARDLYAKAVDGAKGAISWAGMSEGVRDLWRDRAKRQATWNPSSVLPDGSPSFISAQAQPGATTPKGTEVVGRNTGAPPIHGPRSSRPGSAGGPPASNSSSPSDPPSSKTGGVYVARAVHAIPAKVDDLLINILSWPRRHGSATELAFAKWLREYIGRLGVHYEIRAEGCIVAYVDKPLPPDYKEPDVGSDSDKLKHRAQTQLSTTLFSCHIDTVEGWGARSGGKSAEDDVKVETTVVDGESVEKTIVPRKELEYLADFGQIGLAKGSIGGSLGSDDGAGVWLMLNMIERKVPGVYVFHRGEEVGCIGSNAMATKEKHFLEQFKAAVAFDRHDTYEVIRVQGGSICASVTYTDELCKRLNSKGMKYEASQRGVLTDVKHYRGIIPECVNIAVGYDSQHGVNETLDYSHLCALLEAVCAIDWDGLPITRDPKVSEYGSGNYGAGYGGGYGGGYQGGYGRGGHAGSGVDPHDEEYDYAWDHRTRSYSRTDDKIWVNGKGWVDKPVEQPQKELPLDDKEKGVPLSKRQMKKLKKQTKTGTAPMSEILADVPMEALIGWAKQKPEHVAQALGMLLVEVRQAQASNEVLMKLMGWKDDEPS